MWGGTVLGCQIIENESLVNHVQDWSGCRSYSRARRRLKMGHRQNVKIVAVPKEPFFLKSQNTFFVHPIVADQIRRQIAAQQAKYMDDAILCGVLFK